MPVARKTPAPVEDFEPNPRAAPGGNEPPERTLAEILAEETIQLRARATDLIEQVTKANPKDEENCVLVAGLIRDWLREIETERKTRKAPFLHGTRTVDAHFNALAALVEKANQTITRIVDENRRERERKAEAERQRLRAEAERQRQIAEEEARKRAQEAAEAARKIAEAEAARRAAEQRARDAKDAEERQRARAEEAEAARRRDQEAQRAAQVERQGQLAEGQATVNAEVLARQAENTTAGATRSVYGVSAHTRRVRTARITDLTVAIRHARRLNEAAIVECVQKIYDAQVRAGVTSLPGAEIEEDTKTTIRT